MNVCPEGESDSVLSRKQAGFLLIHRGTQRVSLSDPLREGHSELGQAVDGRTAHPRFALLRREFPGAQRGTDEGLIAEHRCLYQGSFPVSHCFLPSSPSFLLDDPNVLVA